MVNDSYAEVIYGTTPDGKITCVFKNHPGLIGYGDSQTEARGRLVAQWISTRTEEN